MNTRLLAAAPGVWTIAFPLKVGGMQFGTRSTIVRLADGGLAVFSPGPFSNDDMAAIGKLGRVRWLIAPNLFHHLYLPAAQAAFPASKTLAAPGLLSKRPKLTADTELPQQGQSPLTGVESIFVAGMPKVNESVFFHAESQTLIVTDLAFNFSANIAGFSKLAMRLNGCHGKFTPSRLCKSWMQDRTAVANAIAKIQALPFRRIVVCHGDLVERDAQQTFRQAFEFLLH